MPPERTKTADLSEEEKAYVQMLRHIMDEGGTVDLKDRVEREGNEAIAYGGYSDVWKGILNPVAGESSPPQIIVLKLMRFGLTPTADLLKRIRQEVKLWSQLDHQNILPFLGISTKYGMRRIGLVSGWQKNGTAMDYLSKVYTNDVRGQYAVYNLIYGIINGLLYLHNNGIVHGDLKGNNVLVSDFGTALLADFGLSNLLDDEMSVGNTANSLKMGAARWTAPERMYPERFNMTHNIARGPSGDIFSFGMTAYELLSGNHPYAELTSPFAVIFAITAGQQPAKLDPSVIRIHPAAVDFITNLTELCYASQPDARPSALQICNLLAANTSLFTGPASGPREASPRRNPVLITVSGDQPILQPVSSPSVYHGSQEERVDSQGEEEPSQHSQYLHGVTDYYYQGQSQASQYTQPVPDSYTQPESQSQSQYQE